MLNYRSSFLDVERAKPEIALFRLINGQLRHVITQDVFRINAVHPFAPGYFRYAFSKQMPVIPA